MIAQIIVAAASRIGSAVYWGMKHLPEIVGTIGGWAVFAAWVAMGRSKVE